MDVDFVYLEASILIECRCEERILVAINTSREFDEPVTCRCKRVYIAHLNIKVDRIES